MIPCGRAIVQSSLIEHLLYTETVMLRSASDIRRLLLYGPGRLL